MQCLNWFKPFVILSAGTAFSYFRQKNIDEGFDFSCLGHGIAVLKYLFQLVLKESKNDKVARSRWLGPKLWT